MYIFYFCYIF